MATISKAAMDKRPAKREFDDDFRIYRHYNLESDTWQLEIPKELPSRPKELNKFGREVEVHLNTYAVKLDTSKVVHQYDISWGGSTDATKRVLLKKIWTSKAVKAALGNAPWIYDGNKLAWSSRRMEREETRVDVDLDGEEGRTSKPGKENTHRIFIKWTRRVDFSGLQTFLDQKAPWSTECIDTINFLDHVLRERPSQLYTQIKKSFFQRGEQRYPLGGGIEAFKGVFSSLRPVYEHGTRKAGIAINVDVANGTFWKPQRLGPALTEAFNLPPERFIAAIEAARKDWKQSQIRRDLGRFCKLHVTATHNPDNPTQWTIDKIVPEDAYQATFPDPDNAGSKISVAQYFKSKYNIVLRKGLPMALMTKKIRKGPVYLPIEYLKIEENQRYNTKLSDTQTSQMIKFAVTLPAERKKAIMNGVNLLQWPQDPYLKHYGIQVNGNPTKVMARVLPPPKVIMGGNAAIQERDLVQGRWRLDNKQFVNRNTLPLANWGVCIVSHKAMPSEAQVKNFVQQFVRIYKSHGGLIETPEPCIYVAHPKQGGEMVAQAYNQTGNKFQKRPTLMMFVVGDRNADMYRRIKRSCDCRFGVASQVLQSRHVQAAQPQYISNVCMKVNAKLGGSTTATKSNVISKVAPQHYTLPTMVIGGDVSHPAPGAGSDEKASFAALTMSSDSSYTRYWAQCDTNGCRIEMITTANIQEHITDMAKSWMTKLTKGTPPKRVLYIRDGVSEGQYSQVLESEVRDMKEVFSKLGVKEMPKFTVVIAGKRHHIRFFPTQGDRNGNPIPGTLVETGCTHPFEFDFYLCSHVAIKGTARPIHYQCILNEGNWHPSELQSFLFEHSYQYVRSTTPVSLHPAVYYAHLAADRSRAHTQANPVSSGPKKEAHAKQETTSKSDKSVEVAPLMKIGGPMGLKDAMWYV